MFATTVPYSHFLLLIELAYANNSLYPEVPTSPKCSSQITFLIYLTSGYAVRYRYDTRPSIQVSIIIYYCTTVALLLCSTHLAN